MLRSFFRFKLLRYILQQLADGQMLRADVLAFAALDAVGRLAPVHGVDVIVVTGVPVAVELPGVHRGEQVGNGDVLRAAVRAVAAGGAGDEMLAAENGLHARDGGELGIVERPEVCHEREIVAHLLHAAHAGEHHHHAGKPCGKPERVAGRTAAVQFIENVLCFLREIDEIAAFDRLHDDDGFAVLHTDLIALAALHRGVVVVQVVELDLHDLDLRILGQDLLEHLGAVVERNADVTHLALGLERECGLIRAARLEVRIVERALRVHQIEIKILHAAGGELLFQYGTNVCLGLKIVFGQLVRKNVALARIAARKTLAQRDLALLLVIAVGGVKIIESGVQKRIHHALGLLGVDLAVLHRQTHKAKAEVLFDLLHVCSPFFDPLRNISIVASGQRTNQETRLLCQALRRGILNPERYIHANYRKGGNTGFDTVITRLRMQTYITIGDYVYSQDEFGRPYGWGIAEYTTPGAQLGPDFVTSAYRRKPEGSRERILAHLRGVLPEVPEKRLLKLI